MTDTLNEHQSSIVTYRVRWKREMLLQMTINRLKGVISPPTLLKDLLGGANSDPCHYEVVNT